MMCEEMKGVKQGGLRHMVSVEFETSELEFFQHTIGKTLEVYEVESDTIPHALF